MYVALLDTKLHGQQRALCALALTWSRVSRCGPHEVRRSTARDSVAVRLIAN